MSRAAERQRSGLWRTEIVRAVLSGHSILGIAFAAVIYIVCLTGALSVFLRDFQRWEQPAAPTVTQASDAVIGRAIAAMGGKVKAGDAFYVSLPNRDFPRIMLSTGGDEDDQTWFADKDGKLVLSQNAPWTEFLVDLHTRLHLPQAWGRFVVGLAGVALLSSLISGVLAHPRIFRDAFHLRLGGSRRLEQADWHNRLGVWPLPFHIIVSLTGALLGLSTLIVGVLALLLFRGDSAKVYALLATPPAKVNPRPAPMPDAAALLGTFHRRAPGANPRQISISDWGQRDMRLEVSAARPTLIAQQDEMTFDVDGAVVAEKHPGGLNLGERILGSLGQLHFGWFGGVALRIVYGVLGLALCIVTASGITVWLSRRRDKGRAAPSLERLWAAISWGQPVALAAPALAVMLVPGLAPGALLAIWGGTTVFAALAAAALVFRPASWIRLVAQLATGGLLMAIGVASLLLRWEAGGDSAALIVDGMLLAGGLGFLVVPIRLSARGIAD
jgi:uncharacterized iron-regulated membrane protein